jgi:hypothetical protein
MNWLVDLQKMLVKHARMAHNWGDNDCLCVCAEGALIKSRVDYMAQFRGHYSNYEEALAVLREIGFEEPISYIASLFKEIEPHEAHDGDIAAVEGLDGTIAFGLFMRQKIFVQMSRGMGKLPRSKALRAFEVPECQQQSEASLLA